MVASLGVSEIAAQGALYKGRRVRSRRMSLYMALFPCLELAFPLQGAVKATPAVMLIVSSIQVEAIAIVNLAAISADGYFFT